MVRYLPTQSPTYVGRLDEQSSCPQAHEILQEFMGNAGTIPLRPTWDMGMPREVGVPKMGKWACPKWESGHAQNGKVGMPKMGKWACPHIYPRDITHYRSRSRNMCPTVLPQTARMCTPSQTLRLQTEARRHTRSTSGIKPAVTTCSTCNNRAGIASSYSTSTAT
jgi:hypothetical protein